MIRPWAYFLLYQIPNYLFHSDCPELSHQLEVKNHLFHESVSSDMPLQWKLKLEMFSKVWKRLG